MTIKIKFSVIITMHCKATSATYNSRFSRGSFSSFTSRSNKVRSRPELNARCKKVDDVFVRLNPRCRRLRLGDHSSH